MKNILSFVNIFILSIILASCAINTSISKRALDDISQDKKGLVIFDCPSATLPINFGIFKADIRPGAHRASTKWINLENKNTVSIFSDADIGFIALNPGMYSLNQIDTSSSDYIYSATKLKNIAYFTVKGGEVIYIGKLLFNFYGTKNIARSVSLSDNINNASKVLNKKYPEMSSRLQKRLIILTPIVKELQESKLSF